MNKEELIKTLLENDLNQDCFNVWARYNEAGKMKYAISLKGSKVVGYDIHLMYIGGISDFEYTYESIEYSLVNALDY